MKVFVIKETLLEDGYLALNKVTVCRTQKVAKKVFDQIVSECDFEGWDITQSDTEYSASDEDHEYNVYILSTSILNK